MPFILPADERPNIGSQLGEALQSGISSYGQASAGRRDAAMREQLAQNPSLPNLLRANLPPQEKAALLSYFAKQGGQVGPTPEAEAVAQRYSAEGSGPLNGPVHLHPKDRYTLNNTFGPDYVKSLEAGLKERNKEFYEGFKANQPYLTQVAEAHQRYRENLPGLREVGELLQANKLSTPAFRALAEKAGVPPGTWATTEDQVLDKLVSSLFPGVLRSQFGGLGQIRSSEIASAMKSLMSGRNSPAANRVIAEIVKRGMELSDINWRAYQKASAEKGRGSFGLREAAEGYADQMARELEENVRVPVTVNGVTKNVPRKLAMEWEAQQQATRQQNAELQPSHSGP
jgi:hypothetical protein